MNSELVEVKGKERIAVFKDTVSGELKEKRFSFLHLVPPQTAPRFVKESNLADTSGFVDVNKYTLRHNRYGNIWCLGDSANLPTNKSLDAVYKQTPVLVNNLI